jgi:FemAB-related protein (PEP-CTERM system-associated)
MSNAYHGFLWQKVISRGYGHKTFALAAVNDAAARGSDQSTAHIVGILPLVYIKTPFFGNRLVSMPFLDHGGIIADNQDCEEKLLQAAISLAGSLKARHIELRQLNKLSILENGIVANVDNSEIVTKDRRKLESHYLNWSLWSQKVRMLLPLPDSSESLLKSFKSKLRSQIKRPIKAGLTVKTGGLELLDEFYKVFSTNMRDLGSPVHAKFLLRCVMEQFQELSKIILVLKSDEPIAAALMVGFKDVMINPWASSLRQHSRESPNMLLYWSMLAYAADHGCKYFDFGRSTPSEGTHRFKVQWGAEEHPMYWYKIRLSSKSSREIVQQTKNSGTRRDRLSSLWSRLPVSVASLLGPMIRKHIEL